MAFPTWCLAELPVHGVWKTRSIGRDLANSTWCIENGQHTYLVKQYAHDQAFGRAPGEAVVADLELDKTGLAPKVIYSNQAQGVVITEWIDGDPVAAKFDPIVRAEQLGKALCAIHQLQPQLKHWSLWQRVTGYCDALAQLDRKAGEQAKEDCASYADLFTAWSEGPRVFCHHDLNAEHVFYEPQMRIIDWEYAGYGHPGFDAASTVVVNDLYDDEIGEFLEAYNANASNAVSRDELRDWIRLIALVNRIWFALQEALANELEQNSENAAATC